MADPGIFDPNDPDGYVANDAAKFSAMKEAMQSAPDRAQKFLVLVAYIRKGYDKKDAAVAGLLTGIADAPEASSLPAPISSVIGDLLGKSWKKRAADARQVKPSQPEPRSDEPSAALPTEMLKSIKARTKRVRPNK